MLALRLMLMVVDVDVDVDFSSVDLVDFNSVDIIKIYIWRTLNVRSRIRVDRVQPNLLSVRKDYESTIILMANSLRAAISVAPMMDWTDRHFRHLLRQISRHALLYTEMVPAMALRYGDQQAHIRLLGYNRTVEGPIVLQVGGKDPQDLRVAGELAVEYGYDEVNLNVGCPSDRVQDGEFGACLMRSPDVVARAIDSMQEGTRGAIPVTIKHRLGVDEYDSDEHLHSFVRTVHDTGVCTKFVVHARKAWLSYVSRVHSTVCAPPIVYYPNVVVTGFSGLSPKQNRTIPPLQYDRVYDLFARFPSATIEINGGIKTLTEASDHLRAGVHGVMIGRAVYEHPFVLLGLDERTCAPVLSDHTADVRLSDPLCEIEDSSDLAGVFSRRASLVEAMARYAGDWLKVSGKRYYPTSPVKLWPITRHMLNIFHGYPGAKAWKNALTEHTRGHCYDEAAMLKALDAVRPLYADAGVDV